VTQLQRDCDTASDLEVTEAVAVLRIEHFVIRTVNGTRAASLRSRKNHTSDNNRRRAASRVGPR
jgi:hypothetical protein